MSVVYIGPKSRTDRPMTKIGTEIAHATRTPLSRSRSPGRFTQRSLNAWESTATLRLLGVARGAWAPTEEERGGAYCVAMRTAKLEFNSGHSLQLSPYRKPGSSAANGAGTSGNADIAFSFLFRFPLEFLMPESSRIRISTTTNQAFNIRLPPIILR